MVDEGFVTVGSINGSRIYGCSSESWYIYAEPVCLSSVGQVLMDVCRERAMRKPISVALYFSSVNLFYVLRRITFVLSVL